MKEVNSKAILNTLRVGGPKSRSVLAKELMLDGTTVTNLVRDLLSKGFLLSSEGTKLQVRGKPGELLSVNPNGAQVGGLSLSEDMTITGILVNLEGEVIFREYIELRDRLSGEKILEQIRKIACNIFNRAEKSKLMGIGIALPGIWQKDKNIFYRSALIPGLRDFKLEELQQTEIPPDKILFTGNLHSLAEAEMWFGESNYDIDTIYAHFDMGIGSACIFDSRLIWRGNGLGGELGHSYVGPDIKCSCGKYGCLEVFASIPAINKRFSEEHSIMMKEETDSEFFKKVVEAFQAEDKLTEQMILDISDKIACVLGNAINLLGPFSVIMGGTLIKLGDRFLEMTTKSLKKYVVPEILQQLTVKKSSLSNDNYAPLGATVSFLKKFFWSS
jgi:predicted NBD/HSP70 family sugar kinase